MKREQSEIYANPERLKGEKISKVIEKIYNKFPPDISEHLVDSNVILTLAGVKGQTEFFIDAQDPKKDQYFNEMIENLASELHTFDPHLVIRTSGKPFNAAADGTRRIMIDLINLKTVEDSINQTKLFSPPPFNKSNGIEGYDSWRREIAKRYGKDSDEVEMGVGIRKGYPDQAILDFIDWYKTGRKKEINYSNIKYTGIYEEAEPNFDFYPEHSDHPDIKEVIRKSEETLTGFYESDWHKNIEPQLNHKKRKTN